MLKSLIENAVNNLKSFYQITSEIDHNGEKGGFREYFVATLLRPLLPDHFGISTGIIIDYEGRQSCQTDIIIFDKRLMSPIWEVESRGIYPIDSVLAVIEVKSKFSSTYCPQVIESARRIGAIHRKDGKKNEKGMHIATPGTTKDQTVVYPLYSIFAYESDAKEKDEFERLKEFDQDALDYVKGICILNKGMWAIANGENHSLNSNECQNAIDFIVILIDVLEKYASQRGTIKLQNWLQVSDEFG